MLSWYWFLLPIPIWLMVGLSPVELNIQIKKRGNDERIDVGVHLFWRLINFDLDIPKIITKKGKIEVEAEVEKPHRKPIIDKNKGFTLSFKMFLEGLCELIVKKDYILKKIKQFQKITKRIVKLDKFEWETEYGVDDAALTGTLYGLVWQLKSTVLFLLNRTVKFRCNPSIKVYPEFNRFVFKTQLNCILKLRLGYIILIGMFFSTMVIKYKISKKLGGGKSVRSSNSRTNENSNGKHQRHGRC